MNTGQAGKKLIQQFEGCRLTAYMPTADDVPTIGWGTTGRDIHLGMSWTQGQADARFARDLDHFDDCVDALCRGHATTQNQFDALVSFAYNLGAAALAGSTLFRLHRAGNFTGAAAQFVRWNKQGQTVLAGLTRRREAEAALYRL